MIGIILTVDGKTKDFVLNYFSLSSVFFCECVTDDKESLNICI